MVLGLMLITAIPTTIGVSQAISAQRKQNQANKEKVRFQMTADLSLDGTAPAECCVVLAEGRLYLDHPDAPARGHKFSGYYFTYPSEDKHLGLVSTIADDPPMLNWIFVESESQEVRHGGRKDTVDELIGSWGWTDDERWLTLEAQETGFLAVEYKANKKWSIHLDRGGGSITDENPGYLLDPRDEKEGRRWAPIRLRRKTALGIESKWVRDDKSDKPAS